MTGDFLPWSDALRDVEEMLDDPELRTEAARMLRPPRNQYPAQETVLRTKSISDPIASSATSKVNSAR